MEYKVIVKRTDDRPDDELFYSDSFLGEEFSDELYHFKYVKKKKVNGKWRYYYDIKDALGYDERAAAGAAVYDYETKTRNANAYNEIRHDPTRVKWYDQTKSDQKYKEAKAAGKVASDALTKYYKTPLGKIDKLDDKIDSARDMVADLLEKASKKIRSREESITNYR